MIVVCAARGYFADDVTTVCAECGRSIQHRPHVPADARKVCVPCPASHVRRQQATGRNVQAVITRDTARDLATYYAKPRGNA